MPPLPQFEILDLFSGIGGFSLGLERASPQFKTAAFCEIDPYNRAVLRQHWPDVIQYDDVRALTAERLHTDGKRPNAICGGFPCQDASSGNPNGQGTDGARTGLFREILRLSNELRPDFIVMENVRNLLRRGFGNVLAGLANIGYDAEWECISCADAGAEHIRDRVWILAYPSGEGRTGFVSKRGRILGLAKQKITKLGHNASGVGMGLVSDIERIRSDNGLSLRMEQRRLFACGNSIAPLIAEYIGREILEAWEG